MFFFYQFSVYQIILHTIFFLNAALVSIRDVIQKKLKTLINPKLLKFVVYENENYSTMSNNELIIYCSECIILNTKIFPEESSS